MAAPLVLVVEDDPVIVQLLSVNFEMEGWQVMAAADGVEGLAAARSRMPDVIVSDVMMPNMDGLELVRELKADAELAGVPVLLLSARAQTDDVRIGLDEGADDYLTKPFEPLELIERVQALVVATRD